MKLPGAEAILLLRAAITKGDFDPHVKILCLDPVEVQRVTEDSRPSDPCVTRDEVSGC